MEKQKIRNEKNHLPKRKWSEIQIDKDLIDWMASKD